MFPLMVQLLCIIAISVACICIINGTVVSSVPDGFCHNSSYTSTCPFWNEHSAVADMGDCTTYPWFQIKCAADDRPVMNISNNLYYVIDFERTSESGGRLTVVDAVTDAQECPQPRRNVSLEPVQFLNISKSQNTNMTIFYNCSSHPENVAQHVPCLDNYSNNTSTGRRTFALYDDDEIASSRFNGFEYCELTVVVPVTRKDSSDGPLRNDNYAQVLKRGFIIDWKQPICQCSSSGMASSDSRKAERIGYVICVGILLLLLFCLVTCIRCWSQLRSLTTRCMKRMKCLTNVQLFLENNYRDLSLQNYKHSDIKKMTNSFNDMLGQGGFGSVFKGKLKNGQLVAVKVLNESKGKGDDFVNEVSTIGRTKHINVVSLLGICAENKKCALVYEFMPNGSLEKFIHAAKDSHTTSSFLGWEKLYQIALGIARGLDYLHHGCNTRILHLDIKPHNILLDQDFCPKISDFGLAKLCPARESTISIAGGRGTLGYTAPEVCSGNLGNVSHKSDIFSYGMMVFEMIGGRKNIDINVETSQIYFPQWIYKHLHANINAEVSENNGVVASGEIFEVETAKKMTIVALWCTQAHPEERPSMHEVVDMLEGKIEDLHFPPNPFPSHSSTSY